VVALAAPVELRRRFVTTASLQEPPECFVMAALWALDFRCGEGIELSLLVPDNLDLGRVRKFLLRRLLDCLGRRLATVAAVFADVCDCNISRPFDLL
jgi:hypothetical protein